MILKKPAWTTIAIALFSTTAVAESVSGLKDSQILAIYTQVNSFDIETAFLAISKDCSSTTTELAQHLAKDHLWVRRTVLNLAVEAGLGYELPSDRLNAQIDHDATIAGLADLDCDTFDAAFLEHDITFHEAAIDAVRTVLLPSTSSPELKTHFEEILPAFERHLAMAIAVREGGSISEAHAHGADQ